MALTTDEARAYPTTASYYGAELAGFPMANGAPFDPYGYTVAHKTLPLGTEVLVCAEACARATVTDRGPYVWGREYDLSLGVALATGLYRDGVGYVDVTVL